MRAYRSPAKLFAFGIVGLILLVASVDVMFAHWISEPPQNNDGVLNTRGQAQQRGDFLWGGVMAGMGALLLGGAVVELIRRKPQVDVGNEAIMLSIGSQEADVTIEWANVEDVASETAIDPYDGGKRSFLVLRVIDRSGLPDDPIGATWLGNELHVDASDWTKRVTDVALSAQGALAHQRRLAEIQAMEPPSITWESSDEGGSPEPTAELKAVGVLGDDEAGPPEGDAEATLEEPMAEDETGGGEA